MEKKVTEIGAVPADDFHPISQCHFRSRLWIWLSSSQLLLQAADSCYNCLWKVAFC